MEARLTTMPAVHAGRYRKMIILLLILMQTIFGAHAFEQRKTISEEENLEMERQLKVINKPPIKSFQTKHGDILDCIDIYKQHAFDHPLLKDHKVQMSPKRIPNEKVGGKSLRFLPRNIRCPPGSVLIKRTKKEELIMAKKMKAFGMNYPTSSGFDSNGANRYVFAYAVYVKHNFGAKAIMNVWNPSVSPNHLSFANVWIANGPQQAINVLQAGWGVHPSLFSSNSTRLMTYWTADGFKNTGCFNYLCPGFVQVSSRTSLGLVLDHISTYNGTQSDIEIGIFRDGEWWLKFYDEFIGYWPQKLFTYIYGGANFVSWGGQVGSPENEPSPPMGSGHFPQYGHELKSAYFKQMQIWDNVNLVSPDETHFSVSSSRPDCYDAQVTHDGGDPSPLVLYYGGPGQCKL